MTEELQQIAAHRKLRLVVDTNLFISSLLSPRGSERALIEACFAGKFELLYCEHLLQEIEDVISRAKFRKHFTVEEGLSLIDAIVLAGTEVPDRKEQKLPRICNDPDDNFLFALYEDGNGDLLVSGDKKALKAAASALWITSADGKIAATLLENRKAWGGPDPRKVDTSGVRPRRAVGRFLRRPFRFKDDEAHLRLAQRVKVLNLRQGLPCLDEVGQCAAGGWAEDDAPHAVAALT